jgi:hypothetical protein
MTLSRQTRRILVTCLAVVGTMSVATLQAGQGWHDRWHHGDYHHGSPYDVRTEARFTGTVTAIQHHAGPVDWCCGGEGGTHLTLQTGAEKIAVHLGPAMFLMQSNITFTVGDAVEILGSRITLQGTPVVIAREIKKGETTWTLRDPSGRPLWGHGGWWQSP